jgi:hypothetical protein
MSFEQDVNGTPGLKGAYRPGLKALPAIDSSRISPEQPRRLTGSVFVEGGLRKLTRFKNAHLWDYVVGRNGAERSEVLHWIEVHPADGTHTIGELTAKLTWLIGWLDGEGKRLGNHKRKIVWIASGRSAFQQNGPQLKQLALKGLYFAGRRYTISD